MPQTAKLPLCSFHKEGSQSLTLEPTYRQIALRMDATSPFAAIERSDVSDLVESFFFSTRKCLIKFGEPTMKYHDKIQLTLIIIASPDLAAEGDRIFQSHGSWMESTHYRTGRKLS